MPNLRRCCSCRQTLPTTEFHAHHSSRSGLQSICKSCRREDDANRGHPWGDVRAAIREQLLAQQGGRCAIFGCRAHLSTDVQWDLDHDHRLPVSDPRSWRGVTCHRHNCALGAAGDNPVQHLALAAYLDRYNQRIVSDALAAPRKAA